MVSDSNQLIKNKIIRNTAKKLLYKVPYLWAYNKDPTVITKATLKYLPRAITIPLRSLPDFIIPGVQKSGTTSLFDYICQHPKINRPIRKEIHFWNKHEERGLSWYRGNFPIKRKNFITGEATPAYLWMENIAKKIHTLVPTCKIIIILRNPVERAFSGYLLSKRQGYEKETFEFAVKHEKERIKKSHVFGYLQKSIYLPQVKKYYDLFDSSNILILNYSDLKTNAEKVTQHCYQFLGLNTFIPNCSTKLNITKNNEKLHDETREYLQQFFEPYNKELYDFLGINFGWNVGRS